LSPCHCPNDRPLGSSVVFSKVFQPLLLCEAELNGFFEAALWLEFFRRIAAFMGITQQGPTTVYADSASAIALLKSAFPLAAPNTTTYATSASTSPSIVARSRYNGSTLF
jgi:hypothetical protein